MKENNSLSLLNPIDRFIIRIKRKRAKQFAIKRQEKRKLYKIKYGRQPVERKPLGFSKWFSLGLCGISTFVIFFSMYATIVLQDSSMMVSLIGGLVTATITIVSSTWKSAVENREGGIIFEAMMRNSGNTIVTNGDVVKDCESDNDDNEPVG